MSWILDILNSNYQYTDELTGKKETSEMSWLEWLNFTLNEDAVVAEYVAMEQAQDESMKQLDEDEKKRKKVNTILIVGIGVLILLLIIKNFK